MEGKEARFGPIQSALYNTSTTGTSTGSVDASQDSLTPIGGLVPLVLIKLGEITPGDVGSGLYGMVVFAIVAVFIAGLMVGRTPEYLGKKIEARDVKYACHRDPRPAGVDPRLLRDRRAHGGRSGGSDRDAGDAAQADGDPVRVRVDDRQQRQRVRGL